jgi:hypothetical protein
MTYTPEGGQPQEIGEFAFKAGGVAMMQHNLNSSIEGFARASFNYGLQRNYSVYFSHKNTILKAYDGNFKDIFRSIYDEEFKAEYEKRGLTYEDRLIDDMVASAPEVGRRLHLGLQELRRRRAVRHRGAGLRLARPDDLGAALARRQHGGVRGRARHGHAPLPRAPEGPRDQHQPDRLDLRLDARPGLPRQVRRHAGRGGLRQRARAGLHRDGGGRAHDQGPRHPHQQDQP